MGGGGGVAYPNRGDGPPVGVELAEKKIFMQRKHLWLEQILGFLTDICKESGSQSPRVGGCTKNPAEV